MNHKLLGKIALIAFLVFVVGIVGMVAIGLDGFSISNTNSSSNFKYINVKESSRSIDLEGAERVKAVMEIGIGEVVVSGGAADLMEGDFVYDEKTGEPDISYSVHNNKGILNISQKERHGLFNFSLPGKTKYKNMWNIKYNENIPLNLAVTTGVGETKLHLSSLNLTNLEIETGVGEVTIDLSGDYKNSFDVDMKTGVGNTELILPKNIGVKIKVNKGVGSIAVYDMIQKGSYYVNDAYEASEIKMDINLEMGVGDVNIRTN